MAANIFGGRFLGRREPAWHGLGKVFDAPIGALEAVEAARLDYRVLKVPVAHSPNEGAPGDLWVSIPGEYALVRQRTQDDPTYRTFGFVGEQYTVVQNVDVAKAVDALTEKWPVETAGAIDRGKTMFLALDAGGFDVRGDPVRSYFLVTDTKDGGTSLKLAFTPVRVVCQNTLSLAIRSSVVTASLNHYQGVADDLAFRVDVVKRLQGVMSKTVEDFNRMAQAALTTDQVKFVVEAAYPLRAGGEKLTLAQSLFDGALDLGEYEDWAKDSLTGLVKRQAAREENVEERRAGAYALLSKFNDTNPNLADTPWAVYNAVVEVEDYRDGKGSVAKSALFGSRAKAKRAAFDAALRASK